MSVSPYDMNAALGMNSFSFHFCPTTDLITCEAFCLVRIVIVAINDLCDGGSLNVPVYFLVVFLVKVLCFFLNRKKLLDFVS